jgi:hypothetical protein
MSKKYKTLKKRAASYSPATCNETQLCRITRDNKDAGDFYIITDSYWVWLSEHKRGEQRKQRIEIPRKEFNKLIRWYLRPQVAVRGNEKGQR